MQDAHDVICEAAHGHVDEIANRREITPRRMYEILGKDNPYPKSKVLIRDIAQFNKPGVRLIKADMDALFADILGEVPMPEITVQRLHKEAYEAIDALLAGKSAADCMKELRDLIAVAELKLEGIEQLEKRGPKRVA